MSATGRAGINIVDRGLLRRRSHPRAHSLISRVSAVLRERLDFFSREMVCAVYEGHGEVFAVPGCRVRHLGYGRGHVYDLCADNERLPFAPRSLDAYVSCLTWQWVNDWPNLLHRVASSLKEGGVLLSAFVGGDSLWQLRRAFAVFDAGMRPRCLPMVTMEAAVSLPGRVGLRTAVADCDRIMCRYDDIRAMLADLRAAGSFNCLSGRKIESLTAGDLQRLDEIYRDAAGVGKGAPLPLSFEIVYLSARS